MEGKVFQVQLMLILVLSGLRLHFCFPHALVFLPLFISGLLRKHLIDDEVVDLDSLNILPCLSNSWLAYVPLKRSFIPLWVILILTHFVLSLQACSLLESALILPEVGDAPLLREGLLLASSCLAVIILIVLMVLDCTRHFSFLLQSLPAFQYWLFRNRHLETDSLCGRISHEFLVFLLLTSICSISILAEWIVLSTLWSYDLHLLLSILQISQGVVPIQSALQLSLLHSSYSSGFIKSQASHATEASINHLNLDWLDGLLLSLIQGYWREGLVHKALGILYLLLVALLLLPYFLPCNS